ncbi:hypothetical protein ONS95_005678 [Cadophora gregata]|uniref:uncharacterized protein n=1 Tax=Cadophora gregata TaxID=51156 RepID=UPI0026DD9BA5|nr:uncharacterized protein ONS95_005678 [Cadophora gregata]KAK0103667.1 hypothetical protein ONS95_005678 [Cadophora gregata]KAK0107860.1 hypothetical protein ONS96_003650 [Cadophora gregata f. sp. sojae]
MRERETSPGTWEVDYEPLTGEWSGWEWDSTAGQYASSAGDPDGILRYEYQTSVDDSSSTSQRSKGKEVQDETSYPSMSTSTGESASRDGTLVTTVREEKKKRVFYYFTNEAGGEVKTRENDWKESSRKVGGKVYQCFEYTGKNSGRVYYTWQLGEA